jgi:hypothetical protein
MPQERPAVVILHYGRAGLTRRLHQQLLASDPGWKDVVRVLDNAAPEPYEDAWHRMDDNLFWAGALDWTARRVREEGFARLWFLNNDCWFASEPPHLERAWARLHRLERSLGPIAAYSPATLANPYHPQMVRDRSQQWRQVALLDGIAPLLDLDALEQVGGVDQGENARGYGVDLWLSLRLHRAGLSQVVDHQVALRHVYHSTARQEPGFLERAAADQDAYLRTRVARDWRSVLDGLKTEWTDHQRMDPAPDKDLP